METYKKVVSCRPTIHSNSEANITSSKLLQRILSLWYIAKTSTLLVQLKLSQYRSLTQKQLFRPDKYSTQKLHHVLLQTFMNDSWICNHCNIPKLSN